MIIKKLKTTYSVATTLKTVGEMKLISQLLKFYYSVVAMQVAKT
jgi:hypothetical protein